jgi:hypothetical protein
MVRPTQGKPLRFAVLKMSWRKDVFADQLAAGRCRIYRGRSTSFRAGNGGF